MGGAAATDLMGSVPLVLTSTTKGMGGAKTTIGVYYQYQDPGVIASGAITVFMVPGTETPILEGASGSAAIPGVPTVVVVSGSIGSSSIPGMAA
jgi:hypothetical protein